MTQAMPIVGDPEDASSVVSEDSGDTPESAGRRSEDRSFIAPIHMGNRVWAVPSIHGELSALQDLHTRLAERFVPGEDRLVYLGNYLGRGPDIVGTLDELLRFRRAILALSGTEPWDILHLRGAQEEMWWKLLKLQMANAPTEALRWMMAHGVDATLEAYGCDIEDGLRHCRGGTMALTRWTGKLRKAMQDRPGHSELMTSLWRAATTGESGLLFVHASVDPSRPLTMQGDNFWWDTGTFERIESPYQGFNRVIRGYDNSHKGPSFDQNFSATLDAGCGFSGPLIAACFNNSGHLIDVIDDAN